MFDRLFAKAHEAGMQAVKEAIVNPMVVQEHANPLDDSSRVEQQWVVEDGVCGFAWVWIKGNTAFGRWAKKNGLTSPGYPTGLNIWAHFFNQSYTRKYAYAQAFAKVLVDAGITAYAGGRLD